MKVKEGVNGALLLDGEVLEGAEEAFKEERYVEAFALIQALIDWRMLNLYQINEMNKGVPPLETHQVDWAEFYTHKRLVRELEKREVISPKESERFREFYDLRNMIVHRLVIYRYQPYAHNRVKREDAIRGFREGKVLVELLRERNPESSGSGEGWAMTTGGG